MAWICTVCLWIVGLSLLSFVLPFLVHAFCHKEQNLKKKYNASWALVTGGSSGIGRALVEKLAAQDLNVVIVALDQPLLHTFVQDLTTQYPQQQFRAVGVDLSEPSALRTVADATNDISVSLLFNNAGYVTIGMFAHMSLESILKNMEVNATSAVRLTHHFTRKMLEKDLHGCVTFTSSPAGLFPCPFSVAYGTTKAFLTEFGASLAGELMPSGIDVLVIHPSPVDTPFYKKETTQKSGSLRAFQKTATSPQVIAGAVLSSVGRCTVIRDQGYFSVVIHLLFKLIDPNLLAWLLAYSARFSSEYKTLQQEWIRQRTKKD